MPGAKHRIKGNRVEREIAGLHTIIGVPAERVPLSGAAAFQGNHEDIDIHVNRHLLHAQVKAMASPRGIKGIISMLGNADLLFIRLDRQQGEPHPRPPLVVMPWETYEKLIKG